MLVIQANLGRHVADAEFLANVDALDAEAGAGTVLFLNEIDEADTPDEHGGLADRLPEFTFAGWSTREPIALGRRWLLRRDRVVKGAPGLAKLTPARTITEAVAANVNGRGVVFLGLHYPRKHWRLIGRWLLLRQVHKGLVRYWHRRGWTVVWASDVNRTRFRKLHRGEQVLVVHGLDRIHYLPAEGGTQLRVVETGVIDLTIDGHDAPWVRLEFC